MFVFIFNHHFVGFQLAEMDLDVFNLNMARHQAEMEIDRKGLTRLEDLPQGWVAWGYSWFGEDGSANSPKKVELVYLNICLN